MAADGLSAPLDRETKRGRDFSAAIAALVPQAIAIALGTFLGTFVLWAVIADNPFGGEPMAVVQISPTGPMTPRVTGGPAARELLAMPGPNASGAGRHDGPPDSPITIPVPPGLPAPRAPGMADSPVNGANTRTGTIIDGKTGAGQEVVIPPGSSSEPPDTLGAPITPERPSAPLSEAHPNGQKLVVRTLSCSSLFNHLAPSLPARGRSVSQRLFTLSSESPLPWCHRWGP
jgi:hypothetical protein